MPDNPSKFSSKNDDGGNFNSEPEDIFEQTDNIKKSNSVTESNSQSAFSGANQNELKSNTNQSLIKENVQNKSKLLNVIIIFIIVVIFSSFIGFGMFWYYKNLLNKKENLTLNNSQTIKLEQNNLNINNQQEIKKEEIKLETQPTSFKNTDSIVEEKAINTKQPIQKIDLPPSKIDGETKKESEDLLLVEKKDSDNDGLSDEEELKYGTDLYRTDTDSDGLFDKEELVKYKTNPLDSDSDSDKYTDGDEVKNGYNPAGPGKLLDIPKNN